LVENFQSFQPSYSYGNSRHSPTRDILFFV
jgi:hypothetical protein